AVPAARVAGGTGPRVAGPGVVGAADTEGLRNAALDRHVRAQLPAAGERVGERVLNVQELAFAYRKRIDAAEHETMACVEGRQRILAPQAAIVLREERVETLIADAAAVVHGLGPRVRRDQVHALAEASRHLHAAGVVVGVEAVRRQLDDAEIWEWDARGDAPCGSGDR